MSKLKAKKIESDGSAQAESSHGSGSHCYLLLQKFLVFLFMVHLNVTIMLILFSRYALNEFICWRRYVIGVCSSHSFALRYLSVPYSFKDTLCTSGLGWILISRIERAN